MASKFGGVPVENAQRSKFGGIPVDSLIPGAGQSGVLDYMAENVGSVVEPLMAMGSGLASSAVGGLGVPAAMGESLATGAPFDEALRSGVEHMGGVQEAATYTPRTESGQAAIEGIGNIAERISEYADIPLSKMGGVIEILSGGDVDRARETEKRILGEEGALDVFGSRYTEEGGSPYVAGMLESAPEVAGILGGASMLPGAAKQAIKAPGALGEKVGSAIAQSPPGFIGEKLGLAIDKRVQSPADQQAAQMLKEGVAYEPAAALELKDVPGADLPPMGGLPAVAPRVQTSPVYKEAISQGFSERGVALMKSANKPDIKYMKEMAHILDRGIKQPRWGMDHRPTDVPGNIVLDVFKKVNRAKSRYGKEIKEAAQGLKNKYVNSRPAQENFYDGLKEMGVTFRADKNGKLQPNFDKSDMVPASANAIKRLLKRGGNVNLSNAYEVHRLKQYIDEEVFGSAAAEGLRGKTINLLKDFRRNLDTSLDDTFPPYNTANTGYSNTKTALDEFQGAMGKKRDLSSPQAMKIIGTKLRALMSDRITRIDLDDSITNLIDVSNRFVPTLKEVAVKGKRPPSVDIKPSDFKLLMSYANELDRVFGSRADTGLQSTIAKGEGTIAKTAAKGMLGDVVGAGKDALNLAYERAKGVNEENALKSLRALLSDLEKKAK